ncbi:MAG: Mth938-like domain-containing protein [Rhodanobacteraceae bacterium]
MELTRDQPEGYFYIRACEDAAVTVVDRTLSRSCIVTPQRVIEDWPVQSPAGLDREAMEILLDLGPELILLGTGIKQEFPTHECLAGLVRRGIGVEVMDNRAASRTYNLLAAEGRQVAAAFMLPG